MVSTIKNLVLFKIGWIACVLFAAQGQPAYAVAAVLIVVGLHLHNAPVVAKELMLLGTAALMGLAWESALVASGLVAYPTAPGGPALAPYWIVAMWVLFATTINRGLAWVKQHWAIAAFAGALGGPLAFAGGAGFGAVILAESWFSLGVIGAGWAILLPLLALVAESIGDSTLFEPEAYGPAASSRPFPTVLRRMGDGV